MKEQFVTYEIASKLKELGFDEECFGYYKEGSLIDPDDVIYERGIHNRITQTYNSGTISAPLWQQVIDWFREAHNLQIEILWRGDMSMFCYKIGRFRYGSHEFSKIDYRQFEEAREQAILKALELIK